MTNLRNSDATNRPLPRLAVLMTCHNRVSQSIRCIAALQTQSPAGVDVELFLVDDGSSDGTSEAITAIYPAVHLIRGNGQLFWSGGTRLAFELAMREDFDFYFWLNDDTNLNRDALARLLSTYRENSENYSDPLIIVGSMHDPDTGRFSYGGWRQTSGFLGLKTWSKISPDIGSTIECDTINGNCVLIERAVVRRIGNLDAVFRQSLGDLDYGLRATKNSCRILIAPGYFGTCRQNTGKGMWTDKRLSLHSRWKSLTGPKGLPIKAWRVFTQRHKGRLWFMSWMAPYILIWFGLPWSAGRHGKRER